ncbi:hypothetical protein BKA61DRAFT_662231 [Leptodontidium sp. MPI-SDFR-AT-0119]|nr:hypothetical protein BKA61DRAFT_662231 [Leptodontidium sp. MPI-SDFR-AT-0119]
MKTIAVMTLVFLPGTAVATIFGTQLVSPDFTNNAKGKLQVSRDFWIFWVLVFSVTGVTLAMWSAWLRMNTNSSRTSRRFSGTPRKERVS